MSTTKEKEVPTKNGDTKNGKSAKSEAENDALEVEPLVAGPYPAPLTGYSALYGPTDIATWNAAVTAPMKAAITDFKVGFAWQHLRQVGTVQNGVDTQSPPQPIYEPRYEAIGHVVTANNINQDLFDFQMYLKRGNAYTGVAS